MSARTVLSLGGNAILPSTGPARIDEQFRITESTMSHVVGLLRAGEQVILTHGNGPFVGNILFRNEAAADRVPPTPLYICGADSQGGIGFMLQQVLGNVLRQAGFKTQVATVVTQVAVDPDDPAFRKPTKPIGPFYWEEEARALERERGWVMVDDAGRGWRRVVASPDPIKIVEIDLIRHLAESGHLVIAAGGGGIPVQEVEPGVYRGIEAVIDKDLAAVVLAEAVQATRLIVVTAVDHVYLNYGTPQQQALTELQLADAQRYLDEGQFPPGSMGPKMRGAIRFLHSGGREVLITCPAELGRALQGESGTRIVR